MSGGPRALRAITPREASIFACAVDAYFEPEPPFPQVRETGTVRFLDDWLAGAPPLNRRGFRALLHALELSPLLGSGRARFRRLPRERRVEWLGKLDAHPLHAIRALAHLGKVAASLGYYGDGNVMRTCGYDPDAKIAAARALREREGRP